MLRLSDIPNTRKNLGIGSLGLVVMVACLFVSQSVFSQAPDVEWLVGHDALKPGIEDFPKAGIVTRDGDFISVGLYADNLMVIKIDQKGKTVWMKSIGKNDQAYGGTCIDETVDGDLIVGGFYSNENDPNGFLSMYSNAFIMKTSDTGDVVWEKELVGCKGDPNIPSGLRILQDISNGGYIICSTVFSGENSNMDFCLIKTDLSGNVEWINTYGGKSDEHCYDLDLTLDSGYILTGHTTSPPAVGWDAYLVKVNRNGDKIWEQSFGEPIDGDPRKIYDECYGVRSTQDGGYIISCGTGIEPEPYRDSTYWGEWRIFVVKTDGMGNFSWDFTSKDIPGEKAGEYVGICNDGGYVVFVDAGNTEYLKLAPDTAANMDFCKLTTTCEGGGYISPSRRYYPKNTHIEITAIPDNGYKFEGWSGDSTGSKSAVTLTMDSDKHIKAIFIKIPDGI